MLILILSGVFVVHYILKSINHFSNMSDFYIIKSFVISLYYLIIQPRETIIYLYVQLFKNGLCVR